MSDATTCRKPEGQSAIVDTTAPIPCICSSGDGAVEIQDLSICYGRQKVVDSVSLTIERNSVTAMIGPSGCGKSSILQSMNRLSHLIPGCVVTGNVHYTRLDNALLARHPILLRRHVGMLFQRPNPFPFSIWKNIEFGLRQHGVRSRTEIADRIESSLREVGLWPEIEDRLTMSALSLSGGQQQRLCLARALALEPTVLLMDEPCSALDPMSTQRIEALIRQLARTRTIVLVTHSLGQARRVSDKVALFWKTRDAGELIEYGKADDIFERPRHELTRTYLEYA